MYPSNSFRYHWFLITLNSPENWLWPIMATMSIEHIVMKQDTYTETEPKNKYHVLELSILNMT